MKTSRWVVAVAVILLAGQMATASQGRRRSAGVGTARSRSKGSSRRPEPIRWSSPRPNGDVTVNVDANTIIRRGSQALTLADIKAGDRVEAEGTKVDDHLEGRRDGQR